MKASTTPGDILPKLKKEFSPWIATPATTICNSITRTGVYPRELRPISILPDLSRDYNNILVDWLLPIIKKRMDPAQLGGIKGCSVTHTGR